MHTISNSLTAVLLVSLLAFARAAADPLLFIGSEGQQAEFAGVLEARIEGLVIQVNVGDRPITVPWNRFDLEDLKRRHPPVHRARENALSGQNPVMLRLGSFAGALTYEEVLANLAADFDRPHDYPVPTFDEYLENYGRQQMRRSQHYFDYARQRARVHEDYQNFIREFFRGEVTLSVSRSAYSANVFSSHPNKNSVRLSARHIIDFFSEENRRGRREAMVYLNYHPRVLDRPMEILARHQRGLPTTLFDSTNLDHLHLPALLENNRNELATIQRERSFPHSAPRQFQRLAEVLDQGRQYQTP